MHKILLFISIVLYTTLAGVGQNLAVDSLRGEFDKVYGLDVLLNNGRKYLAENSSIIGHPFFRSSMSLVGDISVAGKVFHKQRLRYNINKQELILVYTNFNNQQNQIILNSEVVDSFVVDKDIFVLNVFPEIPQKFIQFIYKGNLACYRGWNKELQFNSTGSKVGYQFVEAKCKNYLIYKGVVRQFKNKSSFLDIFEANRRSRIRKFISMNNIRFKEMDAEDLKLLVSFCDNL